MRPRQHPFGSGAVFFYSDLAYQPVTPQALSVIVVQPPLLSPQVEEQHTSVEPLLLELQGDHWVRVGQDHLVTTSSPTTRKKPSPRSLSKPPLATLLIFRDGRAEATVGYDIIGDALYAHSDYWSTGAWTEKIALAELDLAATIHANHERGLLFKLPTGPNEVVLQP